MKNKKKSKTRRGKKVLLLAMFFSLIILVGILAVVLIDQDRMAKEEQEALVVSQEQKQESVEETEIKEPEGPKRSIDDVADKNDVNSYTYVEMDQVYYAAADARVRKLPWDEGELIGTLYMDQTVKVLAQCIETGYYRIKISGGEYYVSEDELSAEYFDIPLPLPEKVEKPTKQKDILFIGNSITLHGPADFWWGDNWGMGATSSGGDYAHLTINAMGYDSYDIMSMRDWELEDARNKDLDWLDKYVAAYDYDIIVIFLGENAKNHEAHFGEDLVSMIEYIRAFNPDAKIVMMDNFWKYDDIIDAKKAAAKEADVKYCSLAELWNVSKYQLYAGQTIEIDGVEYTVDEFVAGHPNNSGMKAISEKLVATLKDL